MKRTTALLVVAALVAGGCGSGDQRETVVNPASTQPAPTSTVAEVPTIVVPDFVGQTSEYARGVLDVLGLTIYIEESADVSGEPDVVVRQLPAAGTAVTPGSLVMVTVPAPQIRKPTLGLSAAAEQLLSETENLKAGHAATIRAASASASSAAIPAATGVTHRGTARHRPVVEWAGQSTNHPTGDPRGPTYGSEGWGFESLRARQTLEDTIARRM